MDQHIIDAHIDVIVNSIVNGKDLVLSSSTTPTFGQYDIFIDEMIANKCINKLSTYDFDGTLLASIIEPKLAKFGLHIKSEHSDNEYRCNERVKGQGCYFTIYNSESECVKGMLLTFSKHAIMMTDVVPK